MIKLLLIFFILIFVGCGQDTDEAVADAVLRANIFLNNRQCQSAIDILEEVGRQNKNAIYLKTLASSYACRAGFDVPTYFQNDLQYIGSPAALGGFSRSSFASSLDSTDNDAYADLQTAIDILLYAGGIALSKDPTVARRVVNFSAAELGDMHTFTMWMIMAQLGKFLYFYGNSSTATGVKGSGTQGNTCLSNYENVSLDVGADADLNAYLLTGVTGACVNGTSGHADMNPINISRLCEGVILFNNFLAIFPEVAASITGDDLDAISGIQAGITVAKAALTVAKPGASTVANVLSHTKCVTDNTADDDFIQVYYVLFLETLLQ